MSFVLFVLGLAAAAAGVLAIGFGIPINEFSLGNTLIIAGSTALAAGLIVLGLAINARQLKKIADLLTTRPVGPGSGRSSEPLETGAGGGRMVAPRPALPAGAELSPRGGPAYSPDRSFQNAAMNPQMDADEDVEFEQPRTGRPGGPPHIPGAPPSFEEDVPLSPRVPPRNPAAGAPPPAFDPNGGSRGWRPPVTRQPAPPAEPVRHEPSIGMPERPQRPAPDAAFDSIWPSGRPGIDPQRNIAAEPAPAPAPAANAARPNGDATHREPPPARPAAENVPVSVLKSGVVDGMAYTLYTDGSIEAELAQGVVRFGSIEELRNHLEKGA